MRLPWLQVEQDGIAQCRRLARLLGVPDAQGIGIGVCVWQYALEIAPDGDFRGFVPDPGILAVEVGWPADDAPNLITQLQRVGIVAFTPKLRVCGLDRYIRGWEKNSGKKAIYRDCGDVVPEPGANPAPIAPVPARQTQTQKQIHTKEEDLAGSPAESVEKLREIWNTNRASTMPAWLKTGRTREKHAKARLKEHTLAELELTIKRVVASDFASGRTGKWAVTPDWLLESPGNITKVLEGNYDNRGPPGASSVMAPTSETVTEITQGF